MSDWHFGMDYDMWLYPPVDWTSLDYNYELPEPIEAANIEGTLLVNAEDAIEQVRHLQAENDKLRKAMDFQALELGCMTDNRDYLHLENVKLRELIQKVWKWESNGCYECPLEKDCKVLCVYDGDCGMAVEIEKEFQELGIEVDDG